VWAREQHVVAASLPQRSAEPGHVHAQSVNDPLGSVRSPQVLDQDVGGHHVVGGQHQPGQQRPLARPAHTQPRPRVVQDVHRAEDAELHRSLRHVVRAQPAYPHGVDAGYYPVVQASDPLVSLQ
jgi:hypothetical protein